MTIDLLGLISSCLVSPVWHPPLVGSKERWRIKRLVIKPIDLSAPKEYEKTMKYILVALSPLVIVFLHQGYIFF